MLAYPASEVLMDGVGGNRAILHIDVPQLQVHEIARQHVAPIPAEFQVGHGRQ